MKSHLIHLLFAGCLTIVFSCRQNPSLVQVKDIPIDFKNIKTIDMDSTNTKIISFETTEQSLLYNIDEICFWKSKIIVFTRNKLCVFDNAGKFLFNVSGKGNGPEEYASLANFFVQDESINLFDSDTKRILSFNADGRFISSTAMPSDANNHFPAVLYPTGHDSYYIAKNRFEGDHVQTPTLSVWTKEYKPVGEINGCYLTTGLSVPDMFSCHQDNILYWELLNDTIFSIMNYERILPKYYVNFQDKTIPAYERAGKGLYDLIQYTNRPEVIKQIATRIGYIHEDEKYIRFIFWFQQKLHYVKYDKNSQSVSTYCFTGEKLNVKMSYFMDIQDDNLILSAFIKDSDENPVLLLINEKEF
jgi:hypothetical protein